MSLVINHNLMAQTAARNLRDSYSMLSDSVRKLSSGLRIEQAADDPAGMAVRELMRSEVAAMGQGIRNANDAVSLIQTADGALSVIDEKLIRMKELAMQAATGTYNSSQRLIIDSEYQQMANEIDRIANATDFNGIHLLNGNLSADHDGSGLGQVGKLKIHFGTGNDSAEDYYYISIKAADFNTLMGLRDATADDLNTAFDSMMDAARTQMRDDLLAGGMVGALLANQSSTDWYDDIMAAYEGAIPGADPTTVDEFNTAFAAAQAQAAVSTAIGRGYGGANEPYIEPEWQEANQAVRNHSPTYSLGSGADVRTQSAAQHALDGLKNAIVSKDNIRANLGALQNRLENTISNLEIQRENLQAAESRISDVDVSLEMTNFVRSQILTQAATAMLAQANTLPRMALQLIGG